MVRADGLAALSLRALAHAVDMEPQSLYTYFASKNALYDHMFADGNQELARRFAAAEIPDELRAALRAVARLFVEFAAEDQARYQLLFLRTIPGFQPSPESYATAVEILASGRVILTRAGLRDDADFDLWTALVAGLASQQLSNDPGGNRYTRLIDEAVTMFADHVLGASTRFRPPIPEAPVASPS
jgi:AcrR family transcriptional regulator